MPAPMKIGAGICLFPRENCQNKIRGFCHDDGMIKVITGVRCRGKSCLMRCIAEELRPEGNGYPGIVDNRINYGPVLENTVYRYARAQGCKVSVGRIGKLECDFILRNPEMGYAYVQVAMTIMADRATEEREYRPFTQIKDNYPKYLLTRSDPIQLRDGILGRQCLLSMPACVRLVLNGRLWPSFAFMHLSRRFNARPWRRQD